MNATSGHAVLGDEDEYLELPSETNRNPGNSQGSWHRMFSKLSPSKRTGLMCFASAYIYEWYFKARPM